MKEAPGGFLEQHWLHVLQSLDDGVVLFDDADHVAFLNDGAAELTGVSARRARRQSAERLFRGANRWVVDLVVGSRLAGARRARADLSLSGPEGRQRPVRAAASPVLDGHAHTVGTLLTFHDLSYERELQARRGEAERLAHLEVLLAGLAHEIKNPLSGMRGAAQILAAAQPADARARECSQIIVSEADRLDRLLTQLLDLTGPSRLDRRAVNVHELIDRVIAIESAAAPDGPSFVRRFDPSLPPVSADPQRLIQVLLNLVRNAVEASPPKAAITVTTRIENSYFAGRPRGRGRFLSIDVRDQGPGVPAEECDRIFSPFFTTKAGGTGLGLAISRRIVADHGGVLRAARHEGGGAVFTVTLPVAEERP